MEVQMKKQSFLITGVLLLLCASPSFAVKPEIEPGVFIQDGSGNLKVNLYSAPTAADWNNDGAKDLVVGQIINGYVLLYLNQGTDMNPLFNGSSLIESNGSPISVSWG
jgi:hypothetical protein